MENICLSADCTACGACLNICPVDCIKAFVDNKTGSYYMKKDETKCIDCNLCKNVCPGLNKIELDSPIKAYVGWSNISKLSISGASGGIATSLYKWAIRHGIAIVGTVFYEDFSVHYKLTDDETDLEYLSNSKYTYSFTDDIYEKVVEKLQKQQVLFIGLPCHVIALKNYLQVKGITDTGLYTIDLICHGTPIAEYLKQHIKSTEEKKHFTAGKCYFRDSRYGTKNYFFTLYEKDSEVLRPKYKKRVVDDDLYQIGYHSAIIYRESCYKCKYAQDKRCGDITLGDYHGLGYVEPWKGRRKNVSLIFSNTEKGNTLINTLTSKGYITLYERPLEEPIMGDSQLRHPSIVPRERETFLETYERYGDFEKAASISFSKIVRKNKIIKAFHLIEFKRLVRKVLSDKVVDSIKYKLRK